MKFDKHNISHFFIFLTSLIVLLIALPTRMFQKQLNQKIVVLYGHKLYGNLQAIYENKIAINSDVFYLTLDKKYYNLLKQGNTNLLYGLSLKDVVKVVNCRIFICDHGLHFYKILMSLKNIIFIDTNHGIPYHKDALNSIEYFSKFNHVWLMSQYHKELFKKFNYSGTNIDVTGYGRLDNLIQFSNKVTKEKNRIINLLKNEYNLNFETIILMAPTWVHNPKIFNDDKYPYNKLEFFKKLNLIMSTLNCLLIYRPHMNDRVPNEIKEYIDNSKYLDLKEFKNYTNTEDFLKLSDILITDWSSIALDYIILDKPVLFLDSPNPFREGVQDDEMLRFGEIISQNLLEEKIEEYITNDDLYFKKNINQKKVKSKFHDIGLDGLSTKRYLKIINRYLS